jgi:hypothetical protein
MVITGKTPIIARHQHQKRAPENETLTRTNSENEHKLIAESSSTSKRLQPTPNKFKSANLTEKARSLIFESQNCLKTGSKLDYYFEF